MKSLLVLISLITVAAKAETNEVILSEKTSLHIYSDMSVSGFKADIDKKSVTFDGDLSCEASLTSYQDNVSCTLYDQSTGTILSLSINMALEIYPLMLGFDFYNYTIGDNITYMGAIKCRSYYVANMKEVTCSALR